MHWLYHTLVCCEIFGVLSFELVETYVGYGGERGKHNTTTLGGVCVGDVLLCARCEW